MVVPNSIDPSTWLRKHLEEADPDLLRSMVQTFADALMAAEAQGLCNAGYGEVTPERVNSLNGHRTRMFDTRTGSIEPPSRSSATTPTTPSGSSSPDVAPSRRSSRWWPSATWRGSPPAGSRT